MTEKQRFHAKSKKGDNYLAGGNMNIGNISHIWFIVPLIVLGAASFVLFTSFTKGNNQNIQKIPNQQQPK